MTKVGNEKYLYTEVVVAVVSDGCSYIGWVRTLVIYTVVHQC